MTPRDPDFGPTAKYYQYNVDEAKKLLAAAGYEDGLEVISSWVGSGQLGVDLPRNIQVREQMFSEVGITPIANPIDYQTEYPDYREGRGEFEGWAYITGAAPGLTALTHFFWRFHKSSGAFLGYDVNNTGDGSGDPIVDSGIEKALGEFDTESRKAIIHDLQRYLAERAYIIPEPGIASSFVPAWPVLGNFMTYQGDKRGDTFNWWVDETQAPLA